MNGKRPPLDLAALRAKLQRETGPRYWRSLEELAETAEFQDYLANEFPQQGPDWRSPVSRRRALSLMGASLALGGLAACTRQPAESIVPFVRAPEGAVPGKPLFYATAVESCGSGVGVLVENNLGRPTKVEGNPRHPASLGATDAFMQASILTLYDPDRSRVVLREGRISGWIAFLAALSRWREEQAATQGAGLHILTGAVSSPTLVWQMGGLLKQYPGARWHQYEPSAGHSAAGARLAFGRDAGVVYDFSKAAVALSLDSDFLTQGPGSLRYARDFMSRRRPEPGRMSMNRLYVVEPFPTGTGAVADHRLPLKSADVERFARALAGQLGLAGEGGESPVPPQWMAALVKELQAHRGSGVVVAGEWQSPAVHALAHRMNEALGNAGSTVFYTDRPEPGAADPLQPLRELVAEMDAGKVRLLLILGCNPVYDAPADLEFAQRMSRVRTRAHVGLYDDETAELCHWHAPATHEFEAWSDTRAFDGTVTIVQPLILPLFGGRSPHEVIAALAGQPDREGRRIVREYWSGVRPGSEFESFWTASLHEGVVPDSAYKTVPLRVSSGRLPPPAAVGGVELLFRPDPTVWDGRHANNGWLQELPKPATRLTWDNAVLVSPALAERLNLQAEDVAEVKAAGRAVQGPAWIVPGQADGVVMAHLGYGRRRVGRVGRDAGFNAFTVRSSAEPWLASDAQVRKTGGRRSLACTQNHHSLEGRNAVRRATLAEFQNNPGFARLTEGGPGFSLYPAFRNEGYAWGMAIDLNACTGCSACVVACQAENNIPVVGRDQVARGREMHWLRIDRYQEGGVDNPLTHFEPMLCVHCEKAPCEVVCPVAATVHSEEGLNQMVYNRCVGTRYCSNNCPYKVRRFNFLLYSDWSQASLSLLRNPNVTVRSRGVMEKCTYCVQRIQAAKIEAEKQDRRLRDGDVVTACQAACPTQAIVFGDINDKDSRVARLKAGPRNYGVLEELNTQPRTTYLARVRNPNPETGQA